MKIIFIFFILFITTGLLHAQNVGIGTTAPVEKLDVNGNTKTDTLKSNALKIAANAGAGKVLTSDVNGVASWQALVSGVNAVNGLKKTNNNIGLGGILSEYTILRLSQRPFLITDTGNSYFPIIGQTQFPLATSLSSTPVWQNFYNYGLFSINKIDVYVAAFGGSSITAELKDNAGNVIASVTNTYGSIFNDWSSFNLPVTSLIPDSVYRISLTCTGTTQVHYSNGNPYQESCSISPDADIAFRVFGAGDNYLFYLNGNKIGINTLSPTAKLDIAGTLRIRDGSEGAGKALFSDALGNAAWQSVSATTLNGWGTNGNTGTSASNFIGTTDNKPLRFRVNNGWAGKLDTTGSVSFGRGALQNNPANGINTAFGDSSMYINSFGTNNTAVGSKTLFNNIGGFNNTAIGYSALQKNTSGTENSCLGSNSLQNNSSGINNTAVGSYTLNANISGGGNTAVGYFSLTNNINGHYNSAVGIHSLLGNKKGNENIAVGLRAMSQSDSGSYNIALGTDALNSNTGGNSNIAIGRAALKNSVSKSGHLAIGDSALYNNSIGERNIAIGLNSLKNNSGGINNHAFGTDALLQNISGNDNVALGYQSSKSNISGSANTSVGNYSMGNYTGGSYNVAIGVSAMFGGGNGVNNTVVGVDAASASLGSGSDNSVLGTLAMNNASGNRNVALGYKAMSGIAFSSPFTGSSNIALGANALQNSWGNYQIAVGDSALYSASFSTNTNVIAIGKNALKKSTSSDGNTAVGHFALTENLSGDWNTAVGFEALKNNVTNYNTALGYQALFATSNSAFSTAVGFQALPNNNQSGSTSIGQLSGSNCTACTEVTLAGRLADIAAGLGGTLNNSTAIGARATVNASNKVRVGNTTTTVIEGQVGWTFPSDGRFKTNIKEDVPGLQLINLLRPVSYNFETEKFQRFLGTPDSIINETKSQFAASSQIKHTGLIAQELETALKKIGYDFSGLHTPQNEKDNYGIAYDNFVPVVIKALQELDAKNKAAEKSNEELKKQLQLLEQQINSLLEKK